MKIRNPKAHAGGASGSVSIVVSFRCVLYSRLWTVINIVLLADLIVAAVAVSGVGVGASFWCRFYRRIRLCKGPGFSRNFLQLHVIRGRHDWIDGDETESFGRILSRMKKCGQATSFV